MALPGARFTLKSFRAYRECISLRFCSAPATKPALPWINSRRSVGRWWIRTDHASPHLYAATFVGVAISAPQNTPKVDASFRDELAKTLKDPAKDMGDRNLVVVGANFAEGPGFIILTDVAKPGMGGEDVQDHSCAIEH